MKNIILFGSSGQAKVIADIIEQEGVYKTLGLIDMNQPSGAKIFGLEVLGSDNDLPRLVQEHGVEGGIIAVGDIWLRHLIAQKVLKLIPDFNFVKAVHPAAQIGSQVNLKRGTVVMAGAVINSGSEIGEFCIVNTQSSIDHDNIFGDYSSIMPNAATGGNVHVGEFSALGMGANILHKVQIGAHSVIGAGSLVLKNVKEHSVVHGSPATWQKDRKTGEPYL